MSVQGKLLVGIFLVAFLLLVADAIYFFHLPDKFLNLASQTTNSLTPSPTPLLASTPTDKIVWHDMSDIKFAELDLNRLNKSLVEVWLSSPSGTIDYHDPSTSALIHLVVGRYKNFVNNTITIAQAQKDIQINIPSDSSARLWNKTPERLYVASPSLDQLMKYHLLSFGLAPNDLVLVYEAKNINGVPNSQGIWLIMFSLN